MDKKEEIKEIIKPHFGYLNLYLKWDIPLNKVEEFHQITKKDKDIIKKLPKPLNNYGSYRAAINDIYTIKKDVELKRTFKDGLNGKSRSFFKNTIDDPKLKEKYEILINNKQKLEMFFRTSSKPQTITEYIQFIDDVLSFDDGFIDTISRIERGIDYITAEEGAYVFKLEKDYLDMVPACWCIYNNNSEFESWKESQGYDSIWLVVDPHNKNPHRRMVGVDIHKDHETIEYMDSRNDRIRDKDIPISREEFFKIARNRLSKREVDLGDKKTQEMIEQIINARSNYYDEQKEVNPYLTDDYLLSKKVYFEKYQIKENYGRFEVIDCSSKNVIAYAESLKEGEEKLTELLSMRGEL